MTSEQYDQYIRAKNRTSDGLSEDDPVLFFTVNKATGKFEGNLDVARGGRYVLIKLLCAETPTVSNIDIQYIGFKGSTGLKGFPAEGQML
eukprot:m.104997 g.104997  ORF g.104997 m.104997 type:complete len:90 (-) comp22470_c0_seq2:60-329(-)